MGADIHAPARDHITFLTDGVVEAMNSANELFGFERAQQISGQPAASIAQQAQAFGQNDDITVLGVEFTGASEVNASLLGR